MDGLYWLGQGFALALEPQNFIACLAGVIVGTLVGVLPGLGPIPTMAMLLPLTFGMEPTTSLIMFCGIFYGARFGGAVTSILANVPGESSSVMTCLDGHEMAKQGRAGKALGMAAIASFFAGTIGVLGLMLLAPTLANFAISFGPPEYVALMVMGLTLVTFMAGKSMAKALIMACFGLALSFPGIDIISGGIRFGFGQPVMQQGISFVVVAMGLFAIPEILENLEEAARASFFQVPKKLTELLPSRRDLRECFPDLTRSTLLGFFIGVIPGGNPTIATFLAYPIAKASAKDPDSFGKGTLRGVAAPESADNAACSGGLVPLLTLGVPTSGSTALMMAAMLIAGLQPGPLLISEHPDLFWAVIASMYIGNALLLVLNLPLVPLFASLLRLPYHIFYAGILAICSIGVYSIGNSIADVSMMGVFGILGYLFRKFDFPIAPIILGQVLGPILENSLRQSMVIFYGDPLLFFTRPIAGTMLGIALAVLALGVVRWLRPGGFGGQEIQTSVDV